MEDSFFTCQCTDFGHVLQFTLDTDDGDVLLSVQLNRWASFWRRVVMAFRFVFLRPKGYNDAHYDATMLRSEDFARLHALLDRAEALKLAERLKKLAVPPTAAPKSDP